MRLRQEENGPGPARGNTAGPGPLDIREGLGGLCFCCKFSSVIGSHRRAISYLFLLFAIWTNVLNIIFFLTFKRLRLNSGLRLLNLQEILLDLPRLSANLNIPQYCMNNESRWTVIFPDQPSLEPRTSANLINNSSLWSSFKIWHLTVFSFCYFTLLF